MDELVKQYGGPFILFFVIAFVFTMIFGKFGGVGFLPTVGEDVGFIMEDAVKGDVDTGTVNAVLNRDKPTITIKGHLKEKETTVLLDDFVITDADGYVWSASAKKFVSPTNSSLTQAGKVVILSIRDSLGNYYYDSMNHISRVWDPVSMSLKDDTTGIYVPSTGKVAFPLADIYTVKIRIMDYENVESIVECRVSVDYVL